MQSTYSTILFLPTVNFPGPPSTSDFRRCFLLMMPILSINFSFQILSQFFFNSLRKRKKSREWRSTSSSWNTFWNAWCLFRFLLIFYIIWHFLYLFNSSMSISFILSSFNFKYFMFTNCCSELNFEQIISEFNRWSAQHFNTSDQFNHKIS